MTEIDPRLVERMVAHFRRVVEKYADIKGGSYALNPELAEARAIVAQLPAPVDPDLLEAREIAAEKLRTLGASTEFIAATDISDGERDDAIIVHATLAAIKRGRALAAQTPASEAGRGEGV